MWQEGGLGGEAGALWAPKECMREGRPLRAPAEGSGCDVNKRQVAARLLADGDGETCDSHRQRGMRSSQPGGVGGGEAPAKI